MELDTEVKMPSTDDYNANLQKVLNATRDMQLLVQSTNSNSQQRMLTQPDQRFQSNLSFVPTASQG